MSRTNSNQLAELKRAGYPFNPTRPSNWFAGILNGLLSQNRQTDRIDLLGERTLKQMNILTRGKRRAFLLKQVEKAIWTLCGRNVLILYTPTRVKLHPDLSQAKLDKLVNSWPLLWEQEALANKDGNDGRDAGSEEGTDAAIATDNSEDEMGNTSVTDDEEGDLLTITARLPKITIPNHNNRQDRGISSQPGLFSDEDISGPWAAETADAFSKLLSDLSGLDQTVDSPGVPTHLPGETPPQSCLVRMAEASTLLLQPIADAIQKADPSMLLRGISQRSAIIDCTDGSQIDIELRRNGEVRIFVSFPEALLIDVLRHIGSQWLDLVVAIDPKGRYGIQRTIPPATSPSSLAYILLNDIQALEDAAGSAR